MSSIDDIVFNTSPLSHFSRAGRLDVLRNLTEGWKRHAPTAVLDEIRDGVPKHPDLRTCLEADWLSRATISTLEELSVFAQYARVLGTGPRGVGEASTLAWAELHGAMAIVDDEAAKRVAKTRHVVVHGSLWLIVRGLRNGELEDTAACELVDALRSASAVFPCDGNSFLRWADENALL